MPALSVKRVSHWFGDNRVLSDINLEIGAGQIVALVGPSGCGKSTLLRAILGTHPPRQGTISAHGREIIGPTRDVGIVYQHYSLYDFLTAQDNVAFGPMLDQTSIFYRTFMPWKFLPQYRQMRKDATELLCKFGLEKAIGCYPNEMSGGMRQRVAIAQALILKPKILLLDEPFGALDEATREELQVMLLNLYQENIAAKDRGELPPYTILIVTHELNEALYVADRVLGLSQHHNLGAKVPGATIIYDKPAPIFRPDDPRDFGKFFNQKEELRNVVFEQGSKADIIQDYLTFWKEHRKLYGEPHE